MKQRKNQLIIIIIVLFISGFLVASLTSFFAARSSLRSQITQSELPLTSDNVYSEIQHDLINPVFISFMMATNTFLQDWVTDRENDEEKITRYLKEVQAKNKTVTSFFVSEKTKKYYHADGLLKTISKDEERDKWYFRVREMKPDYEINVDIDMANNDAMTIFVNYKVFDYDGNYIGATGVGLTVDAVKMLIDKYQKRYGRSIFIFDSEGNMKLHGRDFNLETNNIFDNKEIASFKKEILSHDQTAFNYEKDGTTFHFNPCSGKVFAKPLFLGSFR